MSAPSFEAFREDMLAKATGFGDELKPDGDWPSLMLIDSEDALNVVPMIGSMLDPQLLVAFIAERESRLLCWVASAWTTDARIFLAEGKRVPSLSRGIRTEAVTLFIADADRSEMWRADVGREPGRSPWLGSWEQMEQAAGATLDNIRTGLKAAQEKAGSQKSG